MRISLILLSALTLGIFAGTATFVPNTAVAEEASDKKGWFSKFREKHAEKRAKARKERAEKFANMSDEEKAQAKEKMKAKRKEMRKKHKEKWESMSEEEKKAFKKKHKKAKAKRKQARERRLNSHKLND